MLLASLSVTMGISTPYDPKNAKVRIIFFIFLFYGLLFSTAFNSFLVGVLTNPRQKEQISNLYQAVSSNLQFNGGTVTLEHIDAKDEVDILILNFFLLNNYSKIGHYKSSKFLSYLQQYRRMLFETEV